MSERYRVKAEMLEAWLKEAREIIAKMELKLHAADNLVKTIDLTLEDWGSRLSGETEECLRKAIADYEGKEET
jgi:hypothetical protein